MWHCGYSLKYEINILIDKKMKLSGLEIETDDDQNRRAGEEKWIVVVKEKLRVCYLPTLSGVLWCPIVEQWGVRSQGVSCPMSLCDVAEVGWVFRALLASTKLSNARMVFMFFCSSLGWVVYERLIDFFFYFPLSLTLSLSLRVSPVTGTKT